MQWLALEVVDRLERLQLNLRGSGIDLRKGDLVAMLVFAQRAVSADALWRLIQPYKAQHAPPRRRAVGTVPVTLRLPSPISLRVDLMVEVARQHAPVYRHDVIGALIMAAPRKSQVLVDVAERYSRALAGKAALPGQDAKRVLRGKPPRPGRRPHTPVSPVPKSI